MKRYLAVLLILSGSAHSAWALDRDKSLPWSQCDSLPTDDRPACYIRVLEQVRNTSLKPPAQIDYRNLVQRALQTSVFDRAGPRFQSKVLFMLARAQAISDLDARQTVARICKLVEKKPGATDALMRARCVVGQLHISMIEEKPDRAQDHIKKLVELFKVVPAKEGQPAKLPPHEARPLIALGLAIYAETLAGTPPYTGLQSKRRTIFQAVAYSVELLHSAPEAIDPETAATVLKYYPNILRSPEGQELEPPVAEIVRRANSVADNAFGPSSDTAMETRAIGTRALAKISNNARLNVAEKKAYADEANAGTGTLIQYAREGVDVKERLRRFKDVEETLRLLGRATEALDILLEQQVLLSEVKPDDVRAIPLLADVAHRLAAHPATRDAGLWSINPFIDQLERLPDTTEGLARTLYNFARTLSAGGNRALPCDYYANVARQKMLLSRALRVAQSHYLTAGMLSPPIDLALKTLSSDVRSWERQNPDAHEDALNSGCSLPDLSAEALVDIDRRIGVLEAQVKSLKSANPLSNVAQLHSDIKDTSPSYKIDANADKRFARLFTAAKAIVEAQNLWWSEEWVELVSDETHRLVLADRPSQALALLDNAIVNALQQPRVEQQVLMELLARYPRNFSNEMRSDWPKPDQLVPLALSAAMTRNDARWTLLFSLIERNHTDGSLHKLGRALTEAKHFAKASAVLALIDDRQIAGPAIWLNKWEEIKQHSKDIDPNEFEAWMNSDIELHDERANLLMDRLLSSGRPNDATALVRSIQKPFERWDAIEKLAKAGLFGAAVDMIASSRPEDRARQRIFVGKMKENESKRGSIFEAARNELELISDFSTRVSTGSDLLGIAPLPEYRQVADELAREIVDEINSRNDAQWQDGKLLFLALEIARFQSSEEVVRIIERISDPTQRGSAWVRCAASLEERGECAAANEFFQHGLEIFQAEPRRLTLSDRDRLFGLDSKLNGAQTTELLADKLYKIDRTARRWEQMNQTSGRQEVGKLLALEAVRSRNWNEAIALLKRAGLRRGDFAKAVDDIADKVGEGIEDAGKPIPLLEQAMRELPSDESVSREALAEHLTRFDLVERALELVKGEERCQWRSSGYASIAKKLKQRAKGNEADIKRIIHLAAESADQCDARGQRITAFSNLAVSAAQVDMLSEAETFAARAESVLFEAGTFNQRVDAAFQRVIEIDTGRLDQSARTELVRTLVFFVEAYHESGRPAEARRAFALVEPMGGKTRYRAEIESLGRKMAGQDAFAAEMQATVDNWKKRAAQEPDDVMNEMRDSLFFSSVADLDIQLDGSRLLTRLARQKAVVTYRDDLLAASARSKYQLLSDDIASHHLGLLKRWSTERPERSRDAANEAFDVMVASQSSAAAVALAKAVARQGLAAVKSSYAQDADIAAREWSNFRDTLIAALSQPSFNRSTNLKDLLASEIEARHRFESGREVALQRADSYLAMTNNASTTAVAEKLAPDEALLFYRVNARDVMVSVVTREGARFFDLKALTNTSLEQINSLVLRVRRSIENGQVLLSIPDGPSSQPTASALFDFQAAYDLWETMFASFSSVIGDKRHLLIVPDGPLNSIPFSVLMKKPLSGNQTTIEAFRSVQWLGKDHAVTVLPTLVRYVQAAPSHVRAEKPFIGFGNPQFSASEPGDIDCSKLKEQPGVTMRGDVAGVFEMVSTEKPPLAQVSKLRNSPPLPQTECELQDIGRTLSADPAYIILRQDATETKLKALSADGELSKFRLVVFATHGLVSGQTGVGEPGLVLTPPFVASAEDDGLLTASEVLRLRLAADLVMLSACNTAEAEKPGAEPLSGLTSAFLFAGARSVLVSHWQVSSSAAQRIATQMISEEAKGLQSESDFVRQSAERLRKAMQVMLEGAVSLAHAHPSYWAPFSIVAR